jgi:hypothetical protein
MDKNRINIDLVRFAVSRAITCQCGSVLDTGRAVLVSRGDNVSVVCRPCWDKVKQGINVTVEVIDGRTGSETEWTGASKAEPVKSEADISGEQVELW